MGKQVESIAQQVAELSAAQSTGKASKDSQESSGASPRSSGAPLTAPERVLQPLEPVSQDTRQSAYDRMQVRLTTDASVVVVACMLVKQISAWAYRL